MLTSIVGSERTRLTAECNTTWFCLFRLHFDWLRRVPVLVLDAGVEFESDPDVRAKLITEVCNLYPSLTHTHAHKTYWHC